MEILLKEVLTLYQAFQLGQANPLVPLLIHYKDYAHWQFQQLEQDHQQSHQQYWLGMMAQPLPVLELPLDFERPLRQRFRGESKTIGLEAQLGAQLTALCQQQGVSLFMVLLATVKVLLYRYSGQEDIIVGTPVAGRDHKDLEGQIGYYLNTLALRTRLNGQQHFLQLLAQVRQNTLAAFEHQMYPFDKLVEALNLERDPGRAPLFDVTVILQNIDLDYQGVEGISQVDIESYPAQLPISKSDLRFQFCEHQGRIWLNLEYNTDLFKPQRIEAILENFVHVVETALSHNEIPLSQIRLLLAEDEKDELSSFFAMMEAT
jgi:non-ribosomal peptide synthetase component F